jgi:hypothetical protein
MVLEYQLIKLHCTNWYMCIRTMVPWLLSGGFEIKGSRSGKGQVFTAPVFVDLIFMSKQRVNNNPELDLGRKQRFGLLREYLACVYIVLAC